MTFVSKILIFQFQTFTDFRDFNARCLRYSCLAIGDSMLILPTNKTWTSGGLTLKNRWSENSKKPWQELTIIKIINYFLFALWQLFVALDMTTCEEKLINWDLMGLFLCDLWKIDNLWTIIDDFVHFCQPLSIIVNLFENLKTFGDFYQLLSKISVNFCRFLSIFVVFCQLMYFCRFESVLAILVDLWIGIWKLVNLVIIEF